MQNMRFLEILFYNSAILMFSELKLYKIRKRLNCWLNGDILSINPPFFRGVHFDRKKQIQTIVKFVNYKCLKTVWKMSKTLKIISVCTTLFKISKLVDNLLTFLAQSARNIFQENPLTGIFCMKTNVILTHEIPFSSDFQNNKSSFQSQGKCLIRQPQTTIDSKRKTSRPTKCRFKDFT